MVLWVTSKPCCLEIRRAPPFTILLQIPMQDMSSCFEVALRLISHDQRASWLHEAPSYSHTISIHNSRGGHSLQHSSEACVTSIKILQSFEACITLAVNSVQIQAKCAEVTRARSQDRNCLSCLPVSTRVLIDYSQGVTFWPAF